MDQKTAADPCLQSIDLLVVPMAALPGGSRAASPSVPTTAHGLLRNLFAPKVLALLVTAVVWLLATSSPALTILSAPAFVQVSNAPLAGVLQLSTDEPSRVSVTVNDGSSVWTRRFFDYSTAHSVPLFGFKPARTNQLTVTVYDRQWNQTTATQSLAFITSPLPTNFPSFTLLHGEPSRMEPGYTLFMLQIHGGVLWYGIIVDNSGQVVWYSVVPSTLDIRQLGNGDLFMPWTTNFVELNLLGQTVKSWLVPTNMPINEHEGLPTSHGTILYLTDAIETVNNYPTSMTISNAPVANAAIVYQKVVEISATNSAVLNTWSPITQLDPKRISYLIVKITGGWDSEHANTILEDPSDNSLIVSLRHQNAVVKISRSTGQLRWILGPTNNWGTAWQRYLLKPVGTPFVWSYGQHSPVITPQGTLLMYDNGNYRASPFATSVPNSTNYSRAVEYSINTTNMTVSQVWDYGRTNVAQRIFTDHEGNAEPEPQTGNVLINFANVEYVNGVAPSPYGSSATMVRLTEVTHEAVPQIVFDLAINLFTNTYSAYKDLSVYRCHRISDLYGHPAAPVGDLTVSALTVGPCLNFSADDTRTYVIQASTDLVNWETLGEPSESDNRNGEFTFIDSGFYSLPGRYYRVVTQ